MSEITKIHTTNEVPIATLCHKLSLPRSTYYRHIAERSTNSDVISTPRNSLRAEERKFILDMLHSPRFVDQTPYHVYYTLLDRGDFYCSVRTMYRLLAEKNETQDRRNQRSHRDAVKPELIATAPNQVWSWDITKLLSVHRLTYYYLYVILDIYSRCVVGWLIADRECQLLARHLIQTTALRQGIQPGKLTLHSDNGPSMTSKTVAQLLEHLGVLKTHNRPYTSNDNPFSESNFKTLKYSPQFPGQFKSIEDSEGFCKIYFYWYNNDHFHSGIHWLTPESVHSGRGDSILEKRHQVLMNAYNENPIRFNYRVPRRKTLKPAYINPPKETSSTLQKEEIMG